MINIENFTDRLQEIMSYYDESASGFAEKIGVQRSGISHILSGRNKPSLDFVLKILQAYPAVNMYWLLLGKGSFPDDSKNTANSNSKTTYKENEQCDIPFSNSPNENKDKSKVIEPQSTNKIERIVIFFKDGTFKSYSH